MLDGATRIDELMQTVAGMGMPAVAMTDHGNLFGAIDFYRSARRHDLNPIIGCELYMAPGSRYQRGGKGPDDAGGQRKEPYHHLGVLAENNTGYRNLMRLSSRAYLEGYWYKPRADKELLAEYAEGLIVLSGCLGGELLQTLMKSGYDAARQVAAWYRDLLGPDHYFIEVQDHGIPEQHQTNPDLIRIAKDLGLKLVATNDSHYTDQRDADAHDALLCIQTGSNKDDPARFKFHGDGHYVKSAEEMHALFADHPDTWRSTLEIAERCRVEIEFGTHHLPAFPVPEKSTEAEELRRKVYEGAVERYPGSSPAELPTEVRERIDYELGVINQMGFPAYFLIVADLCDYARRVGIRVGPGRGSAAGCIVSYCTGITQLDPLEYGLLFERFLNPERISMPDIDMDFDERRRGEMIRYARDTYGDDRVAQIVTFSTIKAKAAIKDAARVLGYPYGMGDRLTKMMPPPVMGKDAPLAKARELSKELGDAWDAEPDAKSVLDTAINLEGLRRQHSIHAAGVVIGAQPITDHCPVLRVDADGEIVTQYDGGMVEDIGLLKMDFLGLRNLTVITDALDHIEDTTGERVEIESIPLDDEATYRMVASGETDGIFQLESAGYKALCRQLKPDVFDDIIALGALYRPGPMAAGLHTEYAKRKHGQSPVTYPHEDLSEILGGSYGLLIYQEQVQQIAQKIAGFSLGEADLIRKAIGKKLMDKMAALKQQFIDGCETQGYGRKLGADLWALIEGFADYAFNKSHSAAYGLITYQTAWLKTHYPVEYMAALLTSVKNHKDKLPAGLGSCRMMGIEVLQPDVNASKLDFAPAAQPSDQTVDGTGGAPKCIRFGLSAVRNVGEQVVDGIIEARRSKGVFTDFADFCAKVDIGVLNRRTIESLIKAGAFESLGHTRKGLLLKFGELVDAAVATKRAEAEGQYSLFGGMDDTADPLVEPLTIPDDEFARSEKLAHEREMLGLYVSDHPLRGLEHVVEELSSHPISVLTEEGAPSSVTVAGILTGIQKKFTKKGEAYLVGSLADLQGGIDVIFFPSTYQQAVDLLTEDALLCVTGRLDNGDPPKIIAMDVRQPDVTPDGDRPVLISCAPQQCTPDRVSELRTILAEHPGSAPVHLALESNGGAPTTLKLDDGLSVSRSPALVAELKRLFGMTAIR